MKNPKTPLILNILGLAVAIAAFMVVAMVRYYDLRYDKSYPGADRIYSVWLMKTMYLGNDTIESSVPSGNAYYQLLTGLPMKSGSQIQSSEQPLEEIEDVCALSGYGYGWQRVAAESTTAPDTISKIQMTTPSYFPFFGIEIKEGSLEKFTDFGNAVISSRLAKILFPHGSAVGQRIVLSQNDGQKRLASKLDTLTVIAVFKDLPQNSSLHDYEVVRHHPPGIFYGNLYVKVKDTTMVNVLKEKMLDRYQTAYYAYWDNVDTTGDEALSQAEYKLKYKDAPQEIDNVTMNSLHDNYSSPNNFWNLEAKQYTTVSKMLSVFGIVLLLLAFLNFTNYAVATVPLFLRKTNIRKIEGCSNVQLRWEMFGRFLLSAVVAFLIAMVIVEVCARTKVIPFVDISLKLTDNMPVVWLSAAVTLLVAVVASLYPVFYTTAAANVESALKSQLATPEKYGKWRKVLLRMQITPASVIQFFASFAIVLFVTLVFVQNHQMKTADVGFETENIYVSKLQKSDPNTTNLALKGYQEDFQYKTMDSLKGEWKKLWEIADVAWAENPILGQGDSYGMVTLQTGDESVSICDRAVSANFFRFFGIKMVEGKDFEEVCNASRNGRILNESALKLTKQWDIDSNRTNAGIDGVVQDFHNMPLINEIEPCIYFAKVNDELVWNDPYIYIKLKDTGKQEVDPTLVNQMNTACAPLGHLGSFTSLKEAIDKEYEKEDDFAKLMALFGVVTLFVTLTGLFGMVMLDCMYRRRELSLRRVYGASTGNQLWKMLRNQLIICVVCFGAAIPLAVSLFHKWQQHFAYKADIPVWPFLATFLTVTLLALAITAWQTLRTLREEPTEAIQ
ncbi:MAG: ABC transporter permease [Bacteroidales bacterium]|nr:ABC transporter permease [Bacteroidales bacterium]